MGALRMRKTAILLGFTVLAAISAAPIHDGAAYHDLQSAVDAAMTLSKDAQKVQQGVSGIIKDMKADENGTGNFHLNKVLNKVDSMPAAKDAMKEYDALREALSTPHPNAAKPHPTLKAAADGMIEEAQDLKKEFTQ